MAKKLAERDFCEIIDVFSIIVGFRIIALLILIRTYDIDNYATSWDYDSSSKISTLVVVPPFG